MTRKTENMTPQNSMKRVHSISLLSKTQNYGACFGDRSKMELSVGFPLNPKRRELHAKKDGQFGLHTDEPFNGQCFPGTPHQQINIDNPLYKLKYMARVMDDRPPAGMCPQRRASSSNWTGSALSKCAGSCLLQHIHEAQQAFGLPRFG